jgi:catechol 2,3-dioxygenase-like lactoylglutathione lyase family enzyme
LQPRRLHHVGVPIRDLERSLAWYRDTLGIEVDLVQTAEGPDVDQTVQLEGVRLRSAFLSLGNTLLELLEYESPVGEDFALRNCDVGAIHVCFEVDDIDAEYQRLTDMGVEFSIAPTRLSGALEGHRYCYFRDPDGIQLELWQLPR